MDAWDITVGDSQSVVVMCDDELPDWVAAKQEVWLSEVDGQTVLHDGRRSLVVRGRGTGDRTILRHLADPLRPSLAWIRSLRRPSGTVVIEFVALPVMRDADGVIACEVGDVVLGDLRRFSASRSHDVSAVLEFLREEVLLPPDPRDALLERDDEIEADTPAAPEVRSARLIVSEDPTEGPLALTIWGRSLGVDVQVSATGAWEVRRVTRSRSRPDRALYGLKARIAVVDRTAAALVREEYRDDLLRHLDVEGTGAFLKLWDEYQNVEREVTIRRAIAVGVMPYDGVHRATDGTWRFALRREARSFLSQLTKGDAMMATSTEPNFVDADARRVPGSFIARFVTSSSDPPWVALGDPGRAPRSEHGADRPPSRGYLSVSLQSDLRRMERRDKARRTLSLQGELSPMPQLGLLIEGQQAPVRAVRRQAAISAKVRDLFGGAPTNRQQEALEVALNTPDIAIIQGPPGTGKSTVIAALQERLAELDASEGYRGRTTLLTSFQHDAVEHIASKTRILGLPGLKVGRRFGSGEGDQLPAFTSWSEEVVRQIRASSSVGDRYDRLRSAEVLLQKALQPQLPDERVHLLRRAADMASGSTRVGLEAAVSAIGSGGDEPVAGWVRHLRRWSERLADESGGVEAALTAAVGAVKVLESAGIDPPADLVELARWSHSEPPPRDVTDAAAAACNAILESCQQPLSSQREAVSSEEYELISRLVADLRRDLELSAEAPDLVALRFAERLTSDQEQANRFARHYSVVLAATCQQAASGEMAAMMDGSPIFENVIVDEAARANPLDLMIPLSMASRRVILVGDHRQLPQMLEPQVERSIRSTIGEEQAEGLKQSLFERMFLHLRELETRTGQARVVTLDTQFRMHPRLADFVSETFYRHDGGLRSEAGTAELGHPVADFAGRVSVWIDVPRSLGAEHKAGTGRARPVEAARTAEVVADLVAAAPNMSVGVITFYGAQRDLICDHLAKLGLMYRRDSGEWASARTGAGPAAQLRVGTVDAFQGTEFDLIVLSIVRSNKIECDSPEHQRRKWGFLTVPNRMCVAVSRQRRLLMVVGDAEMASAPDAARWAPELAALWRFTEQERLQ